MMMSVPEESPPIRVVPVDACFRVDADEFESSPLEDSFSQFPRDVQRRRCYVIRPYPCITVAKCINHQNMSGIKTSVIRKAMSMYHFDLSVAFFSCCSR